MTGSLFLGGLAIIFLGGAAALAFPRGSRAGSWWPAGGTAIGSVAGLAAAAGVLLGGNTWNTEAAWQVPGGRLALTIDPLSAFFLAPLFLVALACALYAPAYLAHLGPQRRLGSHWFFFNGLVVSMALVLTAADTLLFLAVWECMSLTSFFLVAFEQRRPEVLRAAWLYLLACHLAGACLVGMFLLMGDWCGSYGFSDFGLLAPIGTWRALAIFSLGLAGFGTKAGLFPLHVWLPEAHPAAPSHVSALMSAVMVKTGIYGLLRLLTWLPPAPAWWGMALAVLGLTGALCGIALSIVQKDVKRCLAYSTVENVGIVFMGLGCGLYGAAVGRSEIAALGFAGGLLHAWNHSLFKSLLFLGAGGLVHATGTRDLDRMGGLLHRMPWTGTLLIAGCVAIAALPPLNGLVGEWLIYLGLLESGLDQGGFGGLAPLLLVGMLALCGGLALVSFSRLAGLALLGEPRSPEAAGAVEGPASMVLPMVLLLLPCLVIGLWPRGVVSLLAPVAAGLAGGVADWSSLPWAGLAGLGAGALLVAAGLAAVGLLLAVSRRRKKCVHGPTWACGFAAPNSRMSYTAAGFGEITQNHLLPGAMRPDQELHGPQGHFPAPGRLLQESRDPVLRGLFEPLGRRLTDRAFALRWLQQGRLPIYLLYIFLTCALLLLGSIILAGDWLPL